jgi:hypothetical protein
MESQVGDYMKLSMKHLQVWISAISVLATGMTAASAAILEDGDFSTPSVSGVQEHTFTPIGAWNVFGSTTLYHSGAIDPITGRTLSTPTPGTAQAVLLRGSTVLFTIPALPSVIPNPTIVSTRLFSGAVSETINGLTPGATYQVSFYLGSLDGTAQVQARETSSGFSQTMSVTASGGDMNWTKETFDFTVPLHPSRPSDTLLFSGLESHGVPAIGNVTLSLVPEPYQYGLVGVFGLLVFAGRHYFSRRKAA